MSAAPRPARPPLAAPGLMFLLVWTLAVSALLPLAVAQAAEKDSARQAVGDILDSLTHAPPQQQRQTPTGFPGTPARPGASPPRQQQTGPSAPTPPKAPVVKALPGQQPGSPQSSAPLPGSAFSSAPGAAARPSQPASGPATRPIPREAAPPRTQQSEDLLRLEHDGVERLALVRLQNKAALKKGQAARALPLVIFLHGAGGSARQAMQQTGLAELAARAGFIAVFPEGLAAPQGQENAGLQTWNAWTCCGYARDHKSDDVGYLAALIQRLKADYPVDPRRIHLAGFSNGAMLASRFALERPGVLASLASVAGYLPCDAAPPKEALPVLVIHGNHDRMARFGPAQGQARTGHLCEDFPAKAQVDFWVRGLNLKTKPQGQDSQKSRVRVERYGPDKQGRGLVEFVIVKGGGHAWPGGARERYRYCDLPTPDPDATALLWEFFKRQARPGAQEKSAPAARKTGKKTGKS
jgi:polyhydroxybutyrate depolymerase